MPGDAPTGVGLRVRALRLLEASYVIFFESDWDATLVRFRIFVRSYQLSEVFLN